jgi:myo-inositol-1(or 4)-monophosphatase
VSDSDVTVEAESLDLTSLLDLAVSVAHRAGALLIEGRPAGLGVAGTKSSPTDIVTEMDTAAERLIVEALQAARPDDGFLGEEGERREGSTGVTWVIDPIDGTVNYLYQLPAWAVSIAAEIDGRTMVGVVHVPPLGESFTGVRGGGARHNGVPIHVNRDVALDQALVATGFGYDARRRARQAEVLRAVVPAVRDVRRAGSAAIDLCSVACGRLDGYYERGVQRWDVAAGGLIAEEAGARVEGLYGAPPSPELTIAAPTDLFEKLHALLAALSADRD